MQHDSDSLFEASCHYLGENQEQSAPAATPQENDQPAIHACVPPAASRPSTTE